MRCIDRPFICESCDFRFRDIDELRLHKQLRQGVCSSYNRDLHDIYIRKRPRSESIEFNDSFSECDSDKIFEDSSLLENEFKDEADEIKEEPEILDEENNPPKLPKIKIKVDQLLFVKNNFFRPIPSLSIARTAISVTIWTKIAVLLISSSRISPLIIRK